MSLLDIKGLSLWVNERELLKDVSLHVNAHETVGLVGESGSGKSLTARAAIGLYPPGSRLNGSVSLDGEDMVTATPTIVRAQRRHAASMIFQDPRSGINPVRTLGDYLMEPLRRCHGWSREKAESRALALLADVGLPHPDWHMQQYPHQLSGGMLQRVMIAGALTTAPRLLLCDEPTTALDVTTQAEIVQIIAEQQRERGMGVLFITHDINLASAICDRIYVMRGGSIVEEGPTSVVLTAPKHEYTRALISATPRLGTGASPAVETAERDEVDFKTAGVALSVNGVSKTYRTRSGTVEALKDVSFEVAPGEAVGIVGESGSGKSTVARLLVSLEQADTGTISFDGMPLARVARAKDDRLARARTVQIVFQDPFASLDPRIRVGKSLTSLLSLHRKADQSDVKGIALDLLRRVGLNETVAEALPRTLSGGQRQRVAIAKALAVAPRLLVLDEATSALDVSVQAQVLDLIQELRESLRISLVFVSHDLAVVEKVCDRIVVMHKGQVVEQGTCSSVLAAPSNDYTRLLLDSVPRSDWDMRQLSIDRELVERLTDDAEEQGQGVSHA